MNRVGIIGGGAAGLTAAIAAARNGAQVTIVEHTARLGKKLLATGNGRCNLTNAVLEEKHYPGNASFAIRVIEGFDRGAVCELFEQIGVLPYCNPEGYYYPRSLQAASVVKALISEAEHLGVNILSNTTTTEIRKKHSDNCSDIGFTVHTNNGKLDFDRLILACGSKAAPSTGSDGSGYLLAGQFGLKMTTVVPALVPLTSSWKGFKEASGVRVRGRISLWKDGKVIATDRGEFQLADYGLSGIPVFQVSRYATEPLEAELDFFPEYTFNEMLQLLHRQTLERGHIRSADFLGGMIPEKLGLALLKQTKIAYDEPVGNLDNRKLRALTQNMKSLRVPITGTLGFDRAQICAGGVDVSELKVENMECRRIPGLYVVGELVDVDGICGGYNLQFAWSSGYLAGKSAALR
ncbi:MAG: aminoacetone oxidase family FAD-binding enzyme [Lachnospiraceae bacterium]|nr:aminoacetone oxidase family FAD-binding enzyme [Lachnospiraceae bacterium]